MNASSKRTGRPRRFDRDVALRSAMETFWAHGYEGASMSLLTKAMNLSPASLYAAFGSKESLYLEALRSYGGGPTLPACSATSVYAQLEQSLRTAAARFTERGHPPGCMMLSGLLRGGAEATSAAKATASVRRAHLATLADRIDQAKTSGELPPDADAEALARFYMAVLQGMSIQAIDGATAADLQTIVDAALAHWPGSSARNRSDRSKSR